MNPLGFQKKHPQRPIVHQPFVRRLPARLTDPRQTLISFVALKTSDLKPKGNDLNQMIEAYLSFEENEADSAAQVINQIQHFVAHNPPKTPSFIVALIFQVCDLLSLSDEEALKVFTKLRHLYPLHPDNTDALHEIAKLIKSGHIPFHFLFSLLKIITFTNTHSEEGSINCLKIGENTLNFQVSLQADILKMRDYLEIVPRNSLFPSDFPSLSVHRHVAGAHLSAIIPLYKMLLKSFSGVSKKQMHNKEALGWLLKHDSSLINQIGFSLFCCYPIESANDLWILLTHLPKILDLTYSKENLLNLLNLILFNAPSKYQKLIEDIIKCASQAELCESKISILILTFLINDVKEANLANSFYYHFYRRAGPLSEEQIKSGEEVLKITIEAGQFDLALEMLNRLLGRIDIQNTRASLACISQHKSAASLTDEQILRLGTIIVELNYETIDNETLIWMIEQYLNHGFVEKAYELLWDCSRAELFTNDSHTSNLYFRVARETFSNRNLGPYSAFVIWNEGLQKGMLLPEKRNSELTEFLVELAVTISKDSQEIFPDFLPVIMHQLLAMNLSKQQESQIAPLWSALAKKQLTSGELRLTANGYIDLLKRCQKLLKEQAFKDLLRAALESNLNDLDPFYKMLTSKSIKKFFENDPQFLCKVYLAFLSKDHRDHHQTLKITRRTLSAAFSNPGSYISKLTYLELFKKVMHCIHLLETHKFVSSTDFFNKIQKVLYPLVTKLTDLGYEDQAIALFENSCEALKGQLHDKRFPEHALQWCEDLLSCNKFAQSRSIYQMGRRIKEFNDQFYPERQIRVILNIANNEPHEDEWLHLLTRFDCPNDPSLFFDILNFAVEQHCDKLIHHLLNRSVGRFDKFCISPHKAIEDTICYMLDRAPDIKKLSLILEFLVSHRIENGFIWSKFYHGILATKESGLGTKTLKAIMTLEAEGVCLGNIDPELRMTVDCMQIEDVDLKDKGSFLSAYNLFMLMLSRDKTEAQCTELARILELIVANIPKDDEVIARKMVGLLNDAKRHLSLHINYFKCVRLLVEHPSHFIKRKCFDLFIEGVNNTHSAEKIPQMNYRYVFTLLLQSSAQLGEGESLYHEVLDTLEGTPIFIEILLKALLCFLEKKLGEAKIDSNMNLDDTQEIIQMFFKHYVLVTNVTPQDITHLLECAALTSEVNSLLLTKFDSPDEYDRNQRKIIVILDLISEVADNKKMLKFRNSIFKDYINILSTDLNLAHSMPVLDFVREHLDSCLSSTQTGQENVKHAKDCLDLFFSWEPTLQDPVLVDQIIILNSVRQLINCNQSNVKEGIDKRLYEKIISVALNSKHPQLKTFIQKCFDAGCFSNNSLLYCELYLYANKQFPVQTLISFTNPSFLKHYPNTILCSLLERLTKNGSDLCIVNAAFLLRAHSKQLSGTEIRESCRRIRGAINKSAIKDNLYKKVLKIISNMDNEQDMELILKYLM